MADYTRGLLQGVQNAVGSFQEASARREDRELRNKDRMAELKLRGLIENPDGSYDQDPEFLKRKDYEEDIGFYKQGLIPQRDESGRITGAGVNEDFFRAKMNADPMSSALRELQLDKARREQQEAERKATPQGKIEAMSGEQKKRFDQSIAARNAVQDIEGVYSGILGKESGQGMLGKLSTRSQMFDVPFRGDTPYTEARRRFEEYLGRLQSGGQISEGEGQRFRGLLPSGVDDPKIGQQKLRNLSQELETSIRSTGVSPEQAQDLGFLRPSSAGASEKPRVVRQNGQTYTLNPQTGEYE